MMSRQRPADPTMGTIPLFPEPPREHVQPAETMRDADRRATPKWAAHTGTRVACDECVTYLHEHRGQGPLPRSARRVRTLGKQRWRLCQQHAEPREAADKKAAELRKIQGARR